MSTGFPPRCWAEIDLGALKQNVRRIRQKLPVNTRYIAVVKADGYGAGARRIVPVLKSAGAEMFGVANVAEAVEVRQVEPDLPILLLSATFPEEEEFLFEYNLTPTVSTPDEARRYQEIAQRRDSILPVHLKFDTGMGRLGIWHERAEDLFEAVSAAPRLIVGGIYSHFASAVEDPEFTALQRQTFLDIVARRKKERDPLWVHIDNSLGLASLDTGGPFNAVRIGLLQFGILPGADRLLSRFNLAPVITFHARVSVVKELPKGTGVSYGRTHTLRRDSRIAIVTAGYADGVLRASSNRGNVLIRGRRCPFLGNVTMDEVIVDVTDVPEAACGDLATLIGSQEGEEITIDEYSASCGTISWEALCILSKRVARVYR